MLLSDLDFALPAELIAQVPLENREDSRMLVVDRSAGTYRDSAFRELPEMLRAGDVLVLNNTKVFPARLKGNLESGAAIELFLIEEGVDASWTALAKPGKRLKPGKRVLFGDLLSAEVLEKLGDGRVVVRFTSDLPLYEAFEHVGETPLPPYIHRDREHAAADRERYQTVYAASRGAIAAPTAGLHFTPQTLDRVREIGVEIAEVTLHVGYGTFEPVRVDDLSQHRVSAERYEIGELAAGTLNAARADGRRVIAVGTTTTRTLEASIASHGKFVAESSKADLTILPGYKFRAIDALLTNFHLPKSSLLVLVSTFAGRELIMKAYAHAVDARYRFYSYGDCMFIM